MGNHATKDGKSVVLWTDFERVANLPSVHDALTAFSRDATGDNGIEVVRAILDALEARAALAAPVQSDAPYPDGTAELLERNDWTPEDALRFYAEGKHFDVVDGRTRIIDTGAVASNALKHVSLSYLEMKGDAELTELREAVQNEQESDFKSDENALEIFTKLMAHKLAKKAAQGRSGWQQCSQAELSRMLREHVEKGDPVDVANFCMMLKANGMDIAPAHSANVDQAALDCASKIISLFGRHWRGGEVQLKAAVQCSITEALSALYAAPVREAKDE